MPMAARSKAKTKVRKAKLIKPDKPTRLVKPTVAKAKPTKPSKAERIERVTITSALPYVNGVKHLGNLIGSILPADIFHRFCDLMEIDNIFICGTDEHGAQTEISAAQEHMQPAPYSDKYHKIQADIYKRWSFDFTHFGRTSTLSNHKLTQQMFLAMHKAGFIQKGEMLLPFCKHDKKFLADRYVEGTCLFCSYANARGDQCEACGRILDPTDLKDPLCMLCGKRELEFRKEKHLFLDLSRLAPELEAWIAKNKHWPANVRAIGMSWLKEGLKPRCITRNLDWGVRVPLKGYKDLVFYVWFDAPIAYISITSDARKDWKQWWSGDAKIYHFLGKDNIPFHTIFWPGILMAARSRATAFALPHYVAGYEFLNWEGKKFSTSRHVGLFSDEALELFPADYWRYYLSSILPEKKDANFEWSDFQSRINNELIANYGNVFYRMTSFIGKYFGTVPRPAKPGKAEADLQRQLNRTMDRVEKLVRKVKLKDALKEIMLFSDALNRYFQAKEPWFAIRNKATKRDAGTTLYYGVNMLAAVTAMLRPFIPATAETALSCLGLKADDLTWQKLPEFNIKPGAKIRSLILFQRIEDEEIAAAAKRSQGEGEILHKGV